MLFVFLYDTQMMVAEVTETCQETIMYHNIKYILLICICWFVT